MARKSEKAAPQAEDFTPKAVYRAVLNETLQHPATILPAALAAVGSLYLGLFGLSPAAFGATFASVLVAVGGWVVNYFIRGEELAERHVETLRERRRQLGLEAVASLAEEWAALGHADGEKQARELRTAYERLLALLEKKIAEGGGLGAQRLRVLAEDTYREGVEILRQALSVARTLAEIDRAQLADELGAWRAELAAAGGADAALATRIAAHERRLELLDGQARTLARLLAESEELEAALESTYLETAERAPGGVLVGHGQAAAALERAVEAARRAEERLRGLGETSPEDDLYRTAGERRRQEAR